jgi:hypothetical protein
MGFNKVEGHNVLINAKAINASQFKLIEEIIAHYDGVTVLTRKQLRDAHGALRGKRAAPYFVSKNIACKVKGQHGMYDVSRLKLSADAAKAVNESESESEVPAKKAKKSAKKREAKAKREKKTKREEIASPALESPAETPAEA